ncbi:autotransporter outer membrane beta-barrel domain-containing protein [Bartonella sp. HY329]|uniref:autotransporter outer membrane beta-barrel domain-containing protein n=1 Tax=unclassified Bartonella TaxID=2645622 RepID=UPI0021C96B18|nr:MULTISPECIES: autotransporter outer membrane beta-barrel domain-containing protein [unclassified Bartonella]UXM95777.1 autotransporter outer membrane beta-barrel domain-containing protein [Bartonella sp. HY329]UXN10102.1 autotransporter outer membrane beta-barrel domain-containing protein [Bartonella sp. HY328]
MKNSITRLLCATMLCSAFLDPFSGMEAFANIITYDGTTSEFDQLQDDTLGVAQKRVGPNDSADQSDNSILINDSNGLGDGFSGNIAVYGGYSDQGTLISNNKITMTGGSAIIVYGGFSNLGMVQNNQVNLSNAKISNNVYGGYSEDSEGITNNSVVIDNNSSVTGSVYGGLMNGYNGDISRNISANRVTISGNSSIAGDVHGAFVYNNAPNISNILNDNIVEITNSYVKGQVSGAYIQSSGMLSADEIFSLQGNKVNIVNSRVDGSINGAYSNVYGSSSALHNSVTILNSDVTQVNGGNVFSNVEGVSLIVNANSVSISGGSASQVQGGNAELNGYSPSLGQVFDNRVDVDGVTGIASIYGGRGYIRYGSALVNGNQVNVSNSILRSNSEIYGGYAFGGESLQANDNKVQISNSSSITRVYGGFATGGSGMEEQKIENFAQNNMVVISGSDIGLEVVGGLIETSMASDNNILSNAVSIVDSHVGGDVIGGSLRNYGSSIDVTIASNTIELSGLTTIDGSLYGGYAINGADAGHVTNNTVTLNGDQLNILGSLYGGYSITSSGEVNNEFDRVVAGNTLNLNQYRGGVSGIYNFENYNWLLPSSVVNNDVLIHITDNDAVNLDNTNHSVAMINDGNRLNEGDEITMIDRAVGNPAATPTQVTQGQFIIYDVSVKVTDDNRFVLKVNGKTDGEETDTDGTDGHETDTGGTDGNEADNGGGDTDGTSVKPEKPAGYINPRSKAFSEGRIAGLAFLNQANDLIATAGIDNIRIMVRANEDEIYRPHFIPFMIANGSTQRYKTGSHVDIDGFNMAVGLATGFETKGNHKVTLGSFFEYGHGTYDTYNNFATYGSVHADGDVNYKGGGIFGRMEFGGTGLGHVASLAADQVDGLYVEASIRGGKTRNKFDGSNDLIDGEGYRGIYDSKVSYYGGHAAVAYVFNFDEKQALDVYGRYLWMHMDGDTVNIGKDQLHFDKSNSSRMQVGGRYSYAYSQQFKPYVSAAYEYEFDGAISANAYGLSLAEPSLKGSTGIFEAGFLFHPIADNDALSINVNGQGFVGQRQGGGGGAKIKYEF